MQDYRDEIKDFFALDKQLASELEYDIKKYNEQLAQEQELARQADVSGGGLQGPGHAMQVARDPPPQPALCCPLSQWFWKPTYGPGLVRARPFGLCLGTAACSFATCATWIARPGRLPSSPPGQATRTCLQSRRHDRWGV